MVAGIFCIFSLPFNTAYAATLQEDPVFSAISNPKDLKDLRSCNDLPAVFSGYCGDKIVDGKEYPYSAFSVSANDVVKCSTTYVEPDALAFGWFGTTINAKCIVTRAGGGWITYSQGLGWAPVTKYYDASGNENVSQRDVSNPVEDFAEVAGGSILDSLGDVARDIISGVAWLILTLATLILGMAGTLFNWVVVKTVFGFSTFLGNSPGLLIAWGILRDVGNMLLLFGFIFIGIAMILDLHSYPAKKTLPRLIIFAILMNFSLFAAEAVIDTSNVLSSVMYAQSSTDSCDYDKEAKEVGSGEGMANLTSDENCFLNTGIAGKIMEVSGTSGIFDTGPNTYSNPVVLIMLALFATVAAVVLFAGSIMLLIRAVTLAFLMVLAPIGFAALAIPGLQKRGEEWWSKLIHQSFFAPIYLLLIFISLKIAETITGGSATSLAAAVAQPHSSTMGIILSFALVIGFLIGSLVMAKKFGAMGADFAIKTAGGLTYGTMGLVGRRTGGAAFNAAAKGVGKTKWGRSTLLGNFTYDTLNRGAKSSFDLRAMKATKALAKATKLDFGEPGKAAAKGIVGEADAKKERQIERAKGFEQNKKEREAQAAAEAAAAAEKKAQEQRDKETRERVAAERRRTEEMDLKPRREALARKEEEIRRAREQGDEELAKSLEATYATDLKQYEIIERAMRDRIKEIEDAADETRKKSAKKVTDFETRAKEAKNRPKTQYADSIANRGIRIGNANVHVDSMSRSANAQAAKKIREDLNKSKTQIALENLEKSVKSVGDRTHDDLKKVKETVHEEAEAHDNDHDDDKDRKDH